MKITRFFIFTAAAAAAFFSTAMAGGNVVTALNTPAKEAIKTEAIRSGLINSTTTQLKVPDAGYTDFDALSAINDPLYREGSKELLQQIVKSDAAKDVKAAPVYRDAPNSRPASLVKKPRVKKNLPADPVKVKNTL